MNGSIYQVQIKKFRLHFHFFKEIFYRYQGHVWDNYLFKKNYQFLG